MSQKAKIRTCARCQKIWIRKPCPCFSGASYGAVWALGWKGVLRQLIKQVFNNNLTDEVRSETLLCNSCDMPIKANDEKVRDPESDGEYMHVKCAVEESENEGFDDYMERRK